ncbi:aspartyl/asparaginyl beta-hydroxylase domain-containing protein [uncultured Sphingomonas sp.]|uniref:aspartyl/asparaginyl beta-hydroxylase domain-containing protein n=1 Tax=uncultured Sphingomonas sp. TaxID=158754 RepID=UPI0035CB2005
MAEDLEALADAAARSGQMQAARAYLERAPHAGWGTDAWLKLAGMRRATGDAPGALAAADRALTIAPLHPMALLLRASLMEAQGNPAAGEAYGRALAQLPDPPPAALGSAVARARASWDGWRARERDRLLALIASTAPMSAKVERFVTNAVRLTEPDHAGPTHYSFPGLRTQAWWSRESFPWLAELEAATALIAAEFEQAVAASPELAPYVHYPEGVPLGQWAALNRNRDWTALHLLDRGRRVVRNAAACPGTLALLAGLPQPDVPGAGPNAMFSMLAPHTHIPPHTGVANTRLVCHLPLIVPDDCWFRVGEEVRPWQPGHAFVFDDTVEHEAMNGSDRLRVVLIFDVWHPDLTPDERAAVTAVIGGGGEIHRL